MVEDDQLPPVGPEGVGYFGYCEITLQFLFKQQMQGHVKVFCILLRLVHEFSRRLHLDIVRCIDKAFVAAMSLRATFIVGSMAYA